MRRLSRWITLGALFGALLFAGGAVAAQADAPTFEPTDCPFDVPQGVTIECGTVSVPEDHANPAESPMIELAVARAVTNAAEPLPPLVVLAGGPGENLYRNAALSAQGLAPLVGPRDLILFDQRGVGASQPALNCPNWADAFGEETEQFDTTTEEGLAQAREQSLDLLTECGEALRADGIGLEHYTTAASAADVNAIRRALGYDEIALFGVSYGTRLGQQIMADYGEFVSAAVLDSVIPREIDRVAQTPRVYGQQFDEFFADCAADAECSATYRDLRTTYDDLVAELSENPVDITVGGETVPLSGTALQGVIAQGLYFEATIEQMPFALSELQAGNTEPISSVAQIAADISDLITFGLFFATECRGEVAFSNPDDLTAAYEEYPVMEPITGIAGVSSPTVFDICANWGLSEPSPTENDPYTGAVPTLILAGENDPVTPPEWAAMLAENMPNDFFYTIPGAAHSVTSSSRCGLQIMSSFLNDPTTEPDTACIDDVEGLVYLLPQSGEDFPLTDYSGAGFTTRVPEAWQEVNPGVFGREPDLSDNTVLLVQTQPGEDIASVAETFVGNFGLTLPEEPTATFSNDAGLGFTYWEFDPGIGLGLGVWAAQQDGTVYLVLGQSTPAEYPTLREFVFQPVVQNLSPTSE
ncbi:MAG: alpha/beta fold hydrolase [Anaerolineales bacterium]